MGRHPGPSPEELEFIFRSFVKGLSPSEVLEEMQDTEHPRRNVRFIRDRRREFDAARKVLEERVARETDPLTMEQRSRHLEAIDYASQKLRGEIQLPSVDDIFDQPTRTEHLFADRTSWRLVKDGSVEVILPREVNKEVEHLHKGLISHLATSDFSNVTGALEEWKVDCGIYINRCDALLAAVGAEVEAITGTAVTSGDEEHPGIKDFFGSSVCIAIVDGPSLTEVQPYEHYYANETWRLLRWRTTTIAVASSGEKLGEYEELHGELRERFDGSAEAAEIVKLRGELERVRGEIKSELQKFRLTVPLPGYCELCKAVAEPAHSSLPPGDE